MRLIQFRRCLVILWFMTRLCIPAYAAADGPDALLNRTAEYVAHFLDQFSEVKCTEQVVQEKFALDGKATLKQVSTYDYLVIMTSPGGELTLAESRLALRGAKDDKKNTPMLISNGFATLFVIFDPYYAGDFRFTDLGEDAAGGKPLRKIGFQHIPGSRSPAALSVGGREYPLELSGTAWVDPQTGSITRIEATVGDSMQDVGMKSLRADVVYAPVSFRDVQAAYWFPAQVTVDVETNRQHWRNTHTFSDYKRFSVSTEEQVAKQ